MRPLAERAADGDGPRRALVLVAAQGLDERRAFVIRKPAGVFRVLGHVEEDDHPHHNRRQALEKKQPLPSRQAGDAVHRQQRARHRPADDAGGQRRRHERGNRPGTLARGKPLREVIDDAREEAGLGRAKQKAHHVETGGALHEHHARRHEAPRDHDARDPQPRADAGEDDVARHLEQRVADEEDAGAEPVGRRREIERGVHLQRREADVDAIEIGDDVEQEQEGHEPAAHLRQHDGDVNLRWQRERDYSRVRCPPIQR